MQSNLRVTLQPYFSHFTMDQLLTKHILSACTTLFGSTAEIKDVQLQKTRKEFEGDITLVVFPLVKMSKKSPEQTAESIGNYLQENIREIRSFNVVKGFLNISFNDSFWINALSGIAKEEYWGYGKPDSLPRVLVEFASPNTNKPLHLGHLRNIFLGDSVARILKAVGHNVSCVQIINDRGIHICKSMVGWLNYGHGETPENTGLKGDKLVGKYYVEFDKQLKKEQLDLAKQGVEYEAAAEKTTLMSEAREMLRSWENRNPHVLELWNQMNGWVYDGFNVSYQRMGVTFDKLYYESDTYLLGKKEVENGLKSGAFFKKEDGSVWVDLSEEGLEEKALLRKDGTTMYITQDIGTAILRFKDFPDTAYQIYTVGNEQEYHFKVLFAILKKLGFKQAEQNFHLSYGMVELPEGKMKSREGTVVDADDIMDEMETVSEEVAAEQGKLEGMPEDEKKSLYRIIGMAALKYFLLKVDPRKNMLFNPKESIDFNGNTGPFIQYTYVRTLAVLRKATDTGIPVEATLHVDMNLEKAELDMIRRFSEWPVVLAEAAKTYNPSLIAHYSYELARAYNAFYHDLSILREENVVKRDLRISITSVTRKIIGNAMGLLGIEMPSRM